MFLYSSEDNCDEFIAAKHIETELTKLPIFSDPDSFEIKFLIEPYYGNKLVGSSDMMMSCKFVEPKEIEFRNSLLYARKVNGELIEKEAKTILLKNFIVAIETKLHSYEKIRFSEANHLEVFYSKNKIWKNASKQNDDQVWVYRELIDEKIDGRPPLIAKFIYLHNIKKEQFDNYSFKDFPMNIRCNNHGLGFIESICHQLLQFNSPEYVKQKKTIISSANDHTYNFCHDGGWVQKPPKPSKFDIKKMLAIGSRISPPEALLDINQRMIEYRGLGGTGKTIKLLQIARHVQKEEQANVLFLTYNWALIIGLRVTMQQMGIKPMSEDVGGILPESCNRFFFQLAKNLGYITNFDQERLAQERLLKAKPSDDESLYDKIYTKALKELTKDFKEQLESTSKSDVKDFLRENSSLNLNSFADFVLVDEGQDWMPEEQFILEAVFGYKNILVACGDGQETRGIPTIWGSTLTKSNFYKVECQKRNHTLSKGMRMKSNLSLFIKLFAQKTLIDPMYEKLKANDEALGGDIFIVEGDYFKNTELREILRQKRQAEKGDVYPLDLLHCIPPGMKVSDFNHGLDESLIWDGVHAEKRKENPKSEKSLRWVNYRSCRGLEGWITFNHYLDQYWEYEFNTQKLDIAQGSLFENATDEMKRYEAYRWVLIALTRPIDSMVISLKNKDSELGKLLFEIHNLHPTFVHWFK